MLADHAAFNGIDCSQASAHDRRTGRTRRAHTRLVLRDVDATLAAWLADHLPPGAEISFDAPAPHTAGAPLLGLYLNEVREEAEVTPADWSALRGDDGRMIGRLPPQRRYRLTYLVTASAASTLDEHELLGRVLVGCAVHHAIPPAALRGSLMDVGQAVMVRCAPYERGCDPMQLWAAWRIPPRTALDLSVLVPLPVAALTDLPLPPRTVSLSSTRPPGGQPGFQPGEQPLGPAGGGRPGRGRAAIAE